MFATASARTWTSADGGKTFEGDLSSYDTKTKIVEVMKGGVKLSFTVDKLSELDQEWLLKNAADEAEKAKETAAQESRDEARSSSPILKKLKGVKRFTEGRMKRAEIGNEVEFILLYYSASW